jgi:hypothetical protein
MGLCTEIPVVAVLNKYNPETQNCVASAQSFVCFSVTGTEINDPKLQRVCRKSTVKLTKFCIGNNPFSSCYATCKSQRQQTTLEIDLLRLRELQKFWKKPSNKIC